MNDLGAAFDDLYRREVRVLTMVATALTGSPETAVELVQEAFLRAYREWPKVSSLDRPGAWVRRIVINLALDSGRRRTRERAAMSRLHRADPVASPSEPMDGQFWAAVRRLPQRQRLAVVLRYVDDRSVAEIAELMGVTVGTVKTSLFMARKHLATVFDVEESAHDDDR